MTEIKKIKVSEYLGEGTSLDIHLEHQQESKDFDVEDITLDVDESSTSTTGISEIISSLMTEVDKKLMKVSDEYITENFDYEAYQAELESVLAKEEGTRNKAAAVAKFLATEFPKLPYFWGGGHELSVDELVGINKNWGKMEKMTSVGSDSYPVGEEFPYSLDCSGFVSWCLVNAGYELNNCLVSGGCRALGKTISITDNNAINQVQVGDVGWMDGHVGMVIDVNKDSNEVTFAHVSNSGKGMRITTISTETGLVTADDVGVTEDKYGNPVEVKSRVGEELFEEIVLVPYDS